jgi:dipeptidyl-peptidase 4
MTHPNAPRYARAARLTAPKAASEIPNVAVEGYWLDDTHYYFLAEAFEPSAGRILATPSVADAVAQTVESAIPLEVLSGLLSDPHVRIDLKALSAAVFDMPARDRLAVTVGGRAYLVDPTRHRLVEAAEVSGQPALYSPDGSHACFVKGHDIWLRALDTGVERALTSDGAPHNAYGQESESCLSAVSYRKRPYPLGLWSPDSQWFLTHQIDERPVPDLELMQHVPPGGGRPIVHRYRYPMPGDPMPIATFMAIHAASGRMVRFQGFPAIVQSYSPLSFTYRMAWFSAGAAYFLRLDRYNRQADLVALNPAQETGRIVLTEAVESGYLEFHQSMAGRPNVRTLASSGEVVWFSERDGWGHLYLYDAATGKVKNRITWGEWLVRDIVHVDEDARRILFTACGVDPRVDPARRSLCAADLDGSGFEVLIAHGGDVTIPKTEPAPSQDRRYRPYGARTGVSPDGRFAFVRQASIGRNAFRIVELASRAGFEIASSPTAPDKVPPRPFSALAADGVTVLHGVLFFPSDFDERKRYPLVDYIYPGPQIAWQPQSFGSIFGAQARALAELGFVTLMLDTRGMPFRSRAIHQAGYGEMLEPQLADHAAVVRALCQRHSYLDVDRVGIFGQSGGGLAAARALFDYGELFKVGVAVCGNHDNGLLTAMWSDKYRGPGNRESWKGQENTQAAHKLRGKLFLVTGEMDEVVHVGHTLTLVDALVRANRDFDLLIVPGEGHGVLLTSGYVQRRLWDYFVRHLRDEAPPPEFELAFKPHELERQDRNNARERDLFR